MPRRRRPVDLGDVIVYLVGRKKKLKGPRGEIYAYVLDLCLGRAGSLEPEKLCTACATDVQDRVSKRAVAFEKSQLN